MLAAGVTPIAPKARRRLRDRPLQTVSEHCDTRALPAPRGTAGDKPPRYRPLRWDYEGQPGRVVQPAGRVGHELVPCPLPHGVSRRRHSNLAEGARSVLRQSPSPCPTRPLCRGPAPGSQGDHVASTFETGCLSCPTSRVRCGGHRTYLVRTPAAYALTLSSASPFAAV